MQNRNMIDQKLITGYSRINADFDIKESPIQGKGLYSETDLSIGTVVLEILGEKVRHEYDPSKSEENPNWIGVGYEEWLKLGPADIAIYLNHACKPNVIINEKMELVVITPIQAQEELLLDYSTTELDPYWQMNCSCGFPECRKLLRSFQFLPQHLQKIYGKYLAPAFMRTAEVVMNQSTILRKVV